MGAWCFADHMGPELVTETQGLDIGPHPHTGLQTVTWLAAGEVLHGVQLWMAQPEATRHGPAAFEHHAQLPRVELDNAVATVLVDDQVVRPGQLAYLGSAGASWCCRRPTRSGCCSAASRSPNRC